MIWTDAEPTLATAARPSRVRQMTVAALFAALLAASAWIVVPIGTVPVTLQVFIVLLATLLLEPKWAAASVGVYLLLGSAGVPVFAGGVGGLGVLIGPSGGYLWGFALGAFVGAALRGKRRDGAYVTAGDIAACAACVAIIYACGWAQLTLVTGASLVEAFAAGVAPFILIDAAKVVVAVGISAALHREGVV